MGSNTDQPVSTRKYLVFSALLIAVAVLTAYQIARRTAYDVHPDEYIHVDAFCYFENHFWPPDLNSDELIYSSYGWSRVYDQEMVYLVYGQFAKLARSIIDSRPWLVLRQATGDNPAPFLEGTYFTRCQQRAPALAQGYRLLNVLLYLITLSVLFYMGQKHPWPLLIALLMICVPQVTYLFAYANSDAWGLSMSIFLFLFVLRQGDRLFNSWLNMVGLAGLTAMVLLSKETAWLSLPFTYLLVGWIFIEFIKDQHSLHFGRLVGLLTVLILTTFLIILPSNIVYPLTQGDFTAKAEQMREIRALPDYKPSQPASTGYRLRAKGFPFRRIWANQRWYRLTAQSSYGRFGYENVKLSRWAYQLPSILFLILASSTFGFLIYRWRKIPGLDRFMLMVAPVCVLLIILGSMIHSWTFDFQPQGRYLSTALIPLALIFGGTAVFEPHLLRIARLFAWFILYGLCLYVLWFIVLQDSRLLNLGG